MKKLICLFLLCTISVAEDISSLYNRANILQNRREYIEAAALFEKVYEQDATSKWADASLYMTGECLYSAGKFKDALEKGYLRLLNVYKKSDLSEDASYMAGQCYLRMGSNEQCARHYTEFLKKYPDSSWVKEIQGIVEVFTPQEKTQYVVTEYDPGFEQDMLAKALSYHSQNDFDNAEVLYLTLLKKYPDSKSAAKYYFLLAELCGLNQKYSQSLNYYKEAISKGSRSIQSESQYKIGETCYHLKQYNKAIEAYQALINTYPESDWIIDSMYMIAECHQKLENYSEAYTVYTKILERYPKTFWADDIKNNLAAINKILHPEKHKQIVQEEEKKTTAVKNDSYIKTADSSETIARNNMSAARYHYETGLRYKKMKKYYLAAEELEKCIEFGSAYQDVFWELGLILNQLKKFDMSLFYLEKEIAERPQNIGAHSLTAYLYYVKGNYGKAIERYNYIYEHSMVQEERSNAEYAIKNIKKHMF